MRIQNANRRSKKVFAPLEKTRSHHATIDWGQYVPVVPTKMGKQIFLDWPLAEIAERIDWTPFFKTWELHGKYPDILTDKVVGEEATKLFSDATEKLQEIIDNNLLSCHSVLGIFPANGIENDQTELYQDDTRTDVIATLNHLRQQVDRPIDRPYRSLADFVAPKESGVNDYMGAFAVGCYGAEALAKKHEDDLG